MPDPTRICIDIETYGKSEVNRQGDELPPQTRFHPTACRLVDRVRQQDLLLTCAVTPISPDGTPTETMILELDRLQHRTWLEYWLRHATELWGMNLLYDLVFLRTVPALRRALTHRPRIIDLGVRNYQHSELRPERSLKNLGPILGLWSYEEEIRHKRFSQGEWQDLLNYNAQDTHNTVLGITELEKRIQETWPRSAKLSEFATRFYSDLTWDVVHIQEAGVCMSEAALTWLELEQRTIFNEASHEARQSNLILHGVGSATSKNAMMDRIMAQHPEILNDDLLQLTPTTRRVSWGTQNRKLLMQLLPQGEWKNLMRLMDKHSKAQKLLTSYINPLKEKHLVPVHRAPRHVSTFVFPSWHLFPGPFKDGAGSAGGTQQSRITATSPGFQTNPRQIKECFTSRYPEGCLVASDLSQIELRVPGVLSGEETLLAAFRDRLDLHEQRAIAVFGPRVVEEDGWRSHDNERDPRQWAKQFNFADLYRAGVEKLRKLLLDETGRIFPELVIQTAVRQRPTLRPRLWHWQQNLLARAARDGYLVLPFTGQSRYLDADEDHNAILNFPVQTTAGNVLHRLKHYVIPRLPRGVLCFGDIYDALVFDHPEASNAVAEIDGLVQDGIRWLSTNDYWARITDHYDHWCPLEAETELLHTRVAQDPPEAAEDEAVPPDVQLVGVPTLAR